MGKCPTLDGVRVWLVHDRAAQKNHGPSLRPLDGTGLQRGGSPPADTATGRTTLTEPHHLVVKSWPPLPLAAGVKPSATSTRWEDVPSKVRSRKPRTGLRTWVPSAGRPGLRTHSQAHSRPDALQQGQTTSRSPLQTPGQAEQRAEVRSNPGGQFNLSSCSPFFPPLSGYD